MLNETWDFMNRSLSHCQPPDNTRERFCITGAGYEPEDK